MAKKTKPELTEDEVLRSLVCVQLTFSQWDGSVAAPNVSKETEERHGAEKGTTRVTIAHLPKEVLSKLRARAHALRSLWNSKTLPWGDGGLRVVRADEYLGLFEVISEAKRELQELHEDICVSLPAMKADAKKRLNGLYQERAFPTANEIRDRFCIEIHSSPVPLTDQRVEGLSAGAQSLVEKSVRKQIADSLNAALSDIHKQLLDLIADVCRRVSKDDQKGVRYGGMMKSIVSVCDSLAHCNITDDKRLAAMLEKTRSKLTAFDPIALRDDAAERRKVKKVCSDLEGDLCAIFGD